MAFNSEMKYYDNKPLVPIELDPADPQSQPETGGEYAELTTVPLASMYGQYQGDTTQHGYTAHSLCQYPPCPECHYQIPAPPQYPWLVNDDQVAAAYSQLAPQYPYLPNPGPVNDDQIAAAYSQPAPQYPYLPNPGPVNDDQIAAAYSQPAPQYPYLPYPWPVYDDQIAAAYSQPAPQYPYDQYDHVLEEWLPHTVGLNQSAPATLNGEDFNGHVSPDSFPENAASPQITHRSRKRQHESQKKTNKPYVKKPPNAFMLYMKEQRLLVDYTFTGQGSSTVNKALAERWKSMTKREQARYYEEAEEAKLLHAQQHPGWSNRDNYGKNNKRERPRTCIPSTDSSDED